MRVLLLRARGPLLPRPGRMALRPFASGECGWGRRRRAELAEPRGPVEATWCVERALGVRGFT